MDKRMQARFERFAEIRAANPGEDFDRIMDKIYDEETDAEVCAEERRVELSLGL